MMVTSGTDGAAFMRHGEAWSEATELLRSSYRVRMGGAFRGAWLASLSRGLAARELSIDHLHARRTGNRLWIAELHLIALPSARDPLHIDYSSLTTAGEVAPSGAFELDSYRLIESRDYGGTLMLTLEAADSLGLLGSLLGGLAQLNLFPNELHIETRGGRAYDSLWLAGAGGSCPSTTLHRAASDLLSRSCKARSPRPA